MPVSRYKEIEYPKTQVKRAGRVFSSCSSTENERDAALAVINNWRAAHAFPLQVIYVHLKRVTQDEAIVAQRLKRLESITAKLSRFPNMSLSTMQDIGGCRVIVPSLKQVYEIVNRIKKSQWKHKFKEEYDYIKIPKEDGYRCYHMVYSYKSNKNEKYNGLFIEIQVRTKLQHLWATAVETMDAFDGDALKIGRGAPNNRQFFKYASILLQLFEEGGLELDKVRQSIYANDLRNFETKHHILNKLSSVKVTAGDLFPNDIFQQGYFILKSSAKEGKTLINFYTPIEIERATNDYDEYEKKRQPHEDIVLVSTSSIDALKKAYPNYFSNITEFVELMNQFLNVNTTKVQL